MTASPAYDTDLGPEAAPSKPPATKLEIRGLDAYFGKFRSIKGINIAEGGAPAIAEFYRVATEPLKELSLISTDVSGMQLTGEALIDSSRPASMEFGQFGRLIRPTA